MEKYIDNKLIRSFGSCYDPKSIGIPDNEKLSVYDWIVKYRTKIRNQDDIIWLICRKDFLSDKDLRLFAVWCARESFKLQLWVDPRSIKAVNIAEQFANGNSTQEELGSAKSAAWLAAGSAAGSAAWSAAGSAAWSAAWSAARSAARSARSAGPAAWSAQIDKLLIYFTLCTLLE